MNHAPAASLDFGVLTLATPNDYLKAIGLAMSLRVSNPGVPLAVACAPPLHPLLAPYFDHVVAEQPGLRGFVHKVYLDRYSPFVRTLFFDSDVLVFKPVRPYVERWGPGCYSACGSYESGGLSSFGMDRQAVLRKIGHAQLVVIDGAGHAYFRQPACSAIFDQARAVTASFADYAGPIRYNDEDVMDIVMTVNGLPPARAEDFFSRHLSARRGSLQMDARRALCHFIAADTGLPFSPCMMHFANNEAAVDYTRQLIQLFRHFGAPTRGLVRQGIGDLIEHQVRTPLSRRLHAVKRLWRRSHAALRLPATP